MELKNVWKSLVCPLFFLVIMFSLVMPVMAEEVAVTELALFGEDMVSGVTKRTEKTYEAAANVTVISGKFLERYAIRNINDLFEVIEGGWHTMKGADEVLALRGVSGYANDKILFLYDGMLFPTFLGLGENNWPNTFDDVERIEIIKGPNTSVWGGQGTQGTINIVHKGAAQFTGLNTSVVAGKWGMARYNINYVQKPNDDLSYQFLVNSTYYKGAARKVEEWGGFAYRRMDSATITNPLPDYQVFANVTYKDVTMAYRRLEERVTREYATNANKNHIRPIENYADDINFILKKPEYWKNTDWTTTIRFNNMYQMYDVFRTDASDPAETFEMKTEKRWEVDSNVLMAPTEALSVVLGSQVGVWSPQGSGPGVTWNPVTRNWDPNVPGSSFQYDPPEFLPTFTEMGNDIAAAEAYIDAKFKVTDKISVTGGGRYVGEFNPGDQFRDPREKLHKFFPKAAVVVNPIEGLYLKGLYQTSFTRLNTFERYSQQNNIDLRATQKATTSESSEFVVDWRPVKGMKLLASYYHMILYDFVNFVYTGSNWPQVGPGVYRGFFNVGDHQANGIEANLSYDWKNMGGFVSTSHLLKNKIANFATVPADLSGGTGIIDTERDADFNKAAIPRYNVAVGLYFDITENYGVSGVYKIHEKLQNRGHEFDGDQTWTGYTWGGGAQLDLAATAKNVGIKNLNISVIGKNVQGAKWFSSSSMDPEHNQQINPSYAEAKVSYLW